MTRIEIFVNDSEEKRQEINLIITFGGDGTILRAATEFYQDYFPPMISFSGGSLGFMANMEFSDHEEVLTKVFADKSLLYYDPRPRLTASAAPNTSPIRSMYKEHN